ncbi:ZNFX1 [Branchiostoma lanceolatum]|uniref:ZNFX1 protein n=1 Tax=Branchiostoma lanceolatum TaxID=7740 RepID=A0A8K0EWI5_BRALA|nr:ZNFX1 [Branchiostoma lanceolatum]
MPCGEPCDRPRCDHPCRKTRRCGKCKKKQPCIGMCGEPCPDKCRVCNRKELTTYVFGKEDEDDAQFVQLEDCGHVIEVSGLDQWMDTTDKKILLKTCPKCKTPIRRNHRYGNIIKKTLAMIENVKRKWYNDNVQKAQATATANRLMRELHADHDLVKHCGETSADLLWQMQRYRLFARDQIAMPTYENKVLFLKRLAKLQRERRLQIRVYMEKWLCHRTAHVGEQLRVLQAEIWKKGISLDDQAKESLLRAKRRLTGLKPFTATREELVKHAMKKVKTLTPTLSLALFGLCDEGPVQVVKASGLTQGHWCACRNGHVYAIGDRGGATMESACPECRARIVGARHRPRQPQASVGQPSGTGDGRSEARRVGRADKANLKEVYGLKFNN